MFEKCWESSEISETFSDTEKKSDKKSQAFDLGKVGRYSVLCTWDFIRPCNTILF